MTGGYFLLYRTYSAQAFFLRITQGAAGGRLCPGLICVVPSGLRIGLLYQSHNHVVSLVSIVPSFKIGRSVQTGKGRFEYSFSKSGGKIEALVSRFIEIAALNALFET
jgi:hypothetical protein